MATYLPRGVLLKRLKMTKSSNACQSFRITAKALTRLGIICRFMDVSEKYYIFGWACHILGRDRWKIWAKMEKYLIFPGLSKGICPNGP